MYEEELQELLNEKIGGIGTSLLTGYDTEMKLEKRLDLIEQMKRQEDDKWAKLNIEEE